MEKFTYLMPSYFKNFKCKANKCRHNCCHGWQIPISEGEYFKLVTMDCNQELRGHLDTSFIQPSHPTKEKYRIISYNFLGDCPMQRNGLCQIHADLGPEYLPSICQMYPRSLKNINGTYYACCSSSCERVIEMLIDEPSLNMVQESLSLQPTLSYNVSDSFNKQLNHFQQLLSDRSTSLKKSIEQICLEINQGEFTNDLKKDINPIEEALYILSRLVSDNSFLFDIYQQIKDRYTTNLNQYKEDTIAFEKRFANWNYIFENVINNSLLFENFPFVDDRFDQTNVYKGLCASYGLLRFVSIAYTSINHEKEDLVDAISCLFHLIDHTAFYYNINVIVKSAALLLQL